MFVPEAPVSPVSSFAERAITYSTLDAMLGDVHVFRYWTAFAVLLILWGLVWFVRHILPVGDNVNTVAQDTSAVEGANVPHRKFWGGSTGGVTGTSGGAVVPRHNRLDRANEMLRDLTLLLLGALTWNTFARAGTRSVEILAWIYVAISIFWLVFEVAMEHRLGRFVFGIVTFGIALAIIGIGWSFGWF